MALTRNNRLRLRFQAHPSSAAVLRERLAVWLDELAAAEDEVFDISLAANEAFANALEHPYEPTADLVDIEASSADGMITIVIRDYGSWSVGRHEYGSHGMPLMRELMDSVSVDASLDGTRVTLRRRLDPRPLLAATAQTSHGLERLRVTVDNPRLLIDLCNYLAADGCLAQPLTHREALIAIPGAANGWEATETLKMEVRSWQAHHAHTHVALLG